MKRRTKQIRRRALRIIQHPEHPVYLFTLRASELFAIADISRVSRDNTGELIGYQRPEVRRHVQNIVEYLKSDKGQVLFPNSVILALSSDIHFQQSRGPKVDDGLADAGIIELPIPKENMPKPAWIVDGQQRALALTRCNNPDFPVPISAFIADDVDTQREQFLRINSTKPLPRGLITELLPKVSAILPSNLAARRAPAALCELINKDPDSPFFGLIRRASASTKIDKRAKKPIIADATVTQFIQDSFSNPSGCLFTYRNLATGDTDYPGVLKVLYTYWNAVKETFPEAWGKSPTESRLMHGAGLRAMGKLMDRVMATVNVDSPNAVKKVRSDLAKLRPVCSWTSGTWEGMGGMRWNELQNVPSHIRVLSNYLMRVYTSVLHGQSAINEVLPSR